MFITKPRGYATPVNRWQIPKFYYIHQPGEFSTGAARRL
jgi:hypothetical protein